MPGNAPHATERPAILTAPVLASRAAAAALAGPESAPGQWVYRKIAVVATPEAAGQPVTAERWATADNSLGAAYVNGELEVGPWAWPIGHPRGGVKTPRRQPAVSYASLSALPTDPRTLVDLLGETPVSRARAWRGGHAFELIGELLQAYLVPPQPAALLYHALAEISEANDQAVDVTGRSGASFRRTGTGGVQEILVDPEAYQFWAYQFLGDGRDVRASGAWGMTLLEQALVSGPGERPSS